jgi:hypothetical protein
MRVDKGKGHIWLLMRRNESVYEPDYVIEVYASPVRARLHKLRFPRASRDSYYIDEWKAE